MNIILKIYLPILEKMKNWEATSTDEETQADTNMAGRSIHL